MYPDRRAISSVIRPSRGIDQARENLRGIRGEWKSSDPRGLCKALLASTSKFVARENQLGMRVCYKKANHHSSRRYIMSNTFLRPGAGTPERITAARRSAASARISSGAC